MTEFFRRLTAIASCSNGSVKISDESYDRQLRDLVTYLKQSSLIHSTTELNQYLDNLSPSIHTISFLYLLHIQIQSAQSKWKKELPEDLLPGGNLWIRATNFLRTFDPIQIRYAGHEWRQLIELVGRAAQAASKPFLAVKLIGIALNRLDSSSAVFISVHHLFVKLALLSSSYTLALPILDKYVCHFPTGEDLPHEQSFLCSKQQSSMLFITDASGFSSKLRYRDYLQYLLYSGMIYMALKKWDQALHCLSIVISAPTTNSVSKVMVEAYKKWILTGLLGSGKLPVTPRMVAPHVMRVYQALARPYLSLAEAFEKGDVQKMSAEIDLGSAIWRVDNNAGLVSQLMDAFDKYMILKLRRTFYALTIADVLQRASANSKTSLDIEQFVASLAMSGVLQANLSHLPYPELSAMLRFSPTAESPIFREEYIRARLMKGRMAVNAIAERIKQTNHTLELCQENLQFLAKSHKRVDSAGKSGVPSSDEISGGFDIDEDLMGDGH